MGFEHFVCILSKVWCLQDRKATCQELAARVQSRVGKAEMINSVKTSFLSIVFQQK